jgi:hypothetical protein
LARSQRCDACHEHPRELLLPVGQDLGRGQDCSTLCADARKAADVLRSLYWLRLGVSISIEERESDDALFFVSGFGSGAYSAKLLNGPSIGSQA